MGFFRKVLNTVEAKVIYHAWYVQSHETLAINKFQSQGWSFSQGRSRTSDSLNEGLPIKMTREKFQRKWYFFYEKDSRFNLRLIYKSSFLIGQVPIEKYGLKTLFLLFNIKEIENVLLKCFHPPPLTKLILLHTVVVLHFTHHIKTAWMVTGGTLSKCSKTLYYKNLLETYFVTTCR